MKGEINNNTIIVGDFNTPLTPMDRSTKQKINKETQTLNDTIDQLGVKSNTQITWNSVVVTQVISNKGPS